MWKLKKSELLNVLKILKRVGSISSAMAYSTFVLMQRKKDVIIFSCNNRDTYIDIELGLQNPRSELQGSYVVAIKDFELVVRACVDTVSISISEKSMEVGTECGGFVLDLSSFEHSLYTYPPAPLHDMK